MSSAALYIHFPFCRSKCVYCDFYSVTSLKDESPFINNLLSEIELVCSSSPATDYKFSTLYIGGGTPSLMSAEHLYQLGRRLRAVFRFSQNAEWSFEANPGALLDRRLAEFKDAGFNRLTLGVQSFHDSELQFLTRIHSARQAEEAVVLAHESGFENIGIDLIFGIPGQTLETWRSTLERAVQLSPTHISIYGLTYETNTPLWRMQKQGRVARCDELKEREMLLLGLELLKRAGYEHYEISNFAKPGFRSRHNSAYWDGIPFIGLGPSAHSFDGDRRWWNVSDIHRYARELASAKLPIEGGEELDKQARLNELVLLGLRRREGIDLEKLEKTSGRMRDELLTGIEQRVGTIAATPSFAKSNDNALLTLVDDSLCLTRQGLLLYDSLCRALFKVIS